MRHLHTHRATCLIAAIILAGCVFFAWWRSQDIVVMSRAKLRAPLPADAELARGERFYADNCRACHATLPHLGPLAAAPGGRDYFVNLLLAGLDGAIPIAGRSREVFHPPFADDTDEDLAAVLNYMLKNWGNAPGPAYKPGDVAAARQRGLTPADVLAQRRALGGE